MAAAKHILLIDDDIDDQGFFREALKQSYPGITCDIADTAIDALSKLKQNVTYNLIFLDLNMPKMDGFQFLEIVKADEQYRLIPIVILSTSSRMNDIERCKQLGAASFYTKEASFTMLLNMMKQVLN